MHTSAHHQTFLPPSAFVHIWLNLYSGCADVLNQAITKSVSRFHLRKLKHLCDVVKMTEMPQQCQMVFVTVKETSLRLKVLSEGLFSHRAGEKLFHTTAYRKRNAAVQFMSALTVHGCIEPMQTTAINNLGHSPPGCIIGHDDRSIMTYYC